jgi:WD40 repeat protein
MNPSDVSQPATETTTGGRVKSSRSRLALEASQRFLFGDDVFISYARADAMNYALGLANELSRRSISCFLDQWGTPPGDDLPDPLLRALRKSTMLVLVGTSKAAGSEAVRHEVEEFIATGRSIIPISFGGALEGAFWFRLIRGLSLSREVVAALETGHPAEEVVTRIINAQGFTTRNKRLRRTFWFTVGAITVLAAIGGALLSYQTQNALAAGRRADEATQVAADANDMARASQKQAESAQTQRVEAESRAQRAAEAEATARENAQRARIATQLQQNGAESLRLFEEDQLGGLMLAMKAGRGLQSLYTVDPSFAIDLGELQAVSPITALINNVTRVRERNQLARYEGTSLSLTFSPSGAILAAVSDRRTNTIGLFDVNTGREIATVAGEDNELRDVDFSPDGDVLVAGGLNAVKLFSTRNGKELKVLSRDNGYFYSVTFSPDGRLVAAAHDDRVRLWDATTGEENASLVANADDLYQLAFAPDGRLLASAGASGVVVLWDMATRTEIKRLQGHAKSVTDLVFSVDGTYLFTTGLDGKVIAWCPDSASSTVFATATEGRDLLVSPDGRFLAQAGSSRGAARIWEIPGGREMAAFPGPVGAVSFDETGGVLLVSRGDGTIAGHRFDKMGGELVVSGGTSSRLGGWKEAFSVKAHERYSDVRFSPHGGYFASGGEDGRLKLWEISSQGPGVVVRDAFTKEVGDRRGTLEAAGLAVSPDGGTVAAVVDQRRVRLWKLASGLELSPLVTESDVTHAQFTADSRTLVISENDSITLWNVASGKRFKSLPIRRSGWRLVVNTNGSLHAALQGDRVVELRHLPSGREAAPWQASNAVDGLLISPDSTILVGEYSFGSRLGLLDLNSRKEISINPQHRIRDLSFAQSSAFVMTTGDDGLSKIWNSRSGQRMAIGTSERGVATATISADERLVAFTSERQTVEVWDFKKNQPMTTIKLLDFPVYKLTFSPDGRVLAMQRNGGVQTKLWDIIANREIITLRDTDHLDFSANSQLVATHSFDGSTVSLWQTTTGIEIGRISGLPGVIGVHFAPGGNTLIGWSKSGTLMFWPMHVDAWLNAGCAWLARYLELHPTENVTAVSAPDGSVSIRPLCGRSEGRLAVK